MSPDTCAISCSAPNSCARRRARSPVASATACCWRACSRKPANLLVLDEPTNDLDIDTLELLQELVTEYSGTLLLVSHDRAFLDSVVTSLLVLEGDGRVQDFVGGYSDYARWRAEQKAASAAALRAPPPRAAAAAAAATPPPKKKLSYKLQKELAELPARLEQLEIRKQVLTGETIDPGFYARPRSEVTAKLAELAALETEIESAFARWSELEA